MPEELLQVSTTLIEGEEYDLAARLVRNVLNQGLPPVESEDGESGEFDNALLRCRLDLIAGDLESAREGIQHVLEQFENLEWNSEIREDCQYSLIGFVEAIAPLVIPNACVASDNFSAASAVS